MSDQEPAELYVMDDRGLPAKFAAIRDARGQLAGTVFVVDAADSDSGRVRASFTPFVPDDLRTRAQRALCRLTRGRLFPPPRPWTGTATFRIRVG